MSVGVAHSDVAIADAPPLYETYHVDVYGYVPVSGVFDVSVVVWFRSTRVLVAIGVVARVSVLFTCMVFEVESKTNL